MYPVGCLITISPIPNNLSPPLITYPPLFKTSAPKAPRKFLGLGTRFWSIFLLKSMILHSKSYFFRAAGAYFTGRPNMTPLLKEKYFKLTKIDFKN